MIEWLIDFESYYSTKDGISVSLQGLYNYPPAGRPYIFSVVDINDPGRFQFCGTPEQFAQLELPYTAEEVADVHPWAVNSNFDQAMWELLFEPFRNPWQCVSDLGTHHQLPRDLARLSHAVTGERTVDKKARDEMDGVRWEDLDLEGKNKMIRYCLTDSVISAKTRRMLRPMTPFEARVAAHTRYICRRGIRIDVDLLERDIAFLETERHRALLTIPWSGEVNPRQKKELKKPLSMAWLHRWCEANRIPPPVSRAKDSEELDDLMTDHPLLAEIIGNMRAFAKANTMLEKARAVQARVDDRGMMPIEFLYCGAPHTRRWSSKGVNIQNLDMFPIPFGPEEERDLEAAKERYGDRCWEHFVTRETVPVSGGGWEEAMVVERPGGVWTRRWLIPGRGKKFLILDYAQIEPRCLAWLVGDAALLAGVRSGVGIYQTHAQLTMGWKTGSLKKADPRLYKLAKARVIGLGYGCGKAKFVDVARKMAQLVVTPEEAATTVDDYRRTSPLVVNYWKMWDEVIANTMREPGEHHLDITMPNGENMRLWYIQPQFVVDESTAPDGRVVKEKKHVGWIALTVKNDPSSRSYRLWGGKVTENCLVGGVNILTDKGMIKLCDLQPHQKVWDGVEFVPHGGVVSKGRQAVINVHGVRATPDHQFLVGGRWVSAVAARQYSYGAATFLNGKNTSLCAEDESEGRSDRSDFRYLDRAATGRGAQKEVSLGVLMPVREGGPHPVDGAHRKEVLRAPVHAVQGAHRTPQLDPRDDRPSGLLGVAQHEGPLLEPTAPGVPELRRSGHLRLPGMGRGLRGVLAGHGADLRGRAGDRAQGQRRPLLAGELHLGDPEGQCSESTHRNNPSGDTESCRGVGCEAGRSLSPFKEGNGPFNCGHEADNQEEVFDILDCGPRHRFAVFPDDASDRYLIAHNCTQRMARDILAEAILDLVDAGKEVVFSSHDELILEVDEDAGEDEIEECSAIMKRPRSWCWDLPLDVEGGFAAHYIK